MIYILKIIQKKKLIIVGKKNILIYSFQVLSSTENKNLVI